MVDVCFLSDIFKHLNDLNIGLQGRDKTVIDLLEQIAFQVKLDLFASDLSTGRMLHFLTLCRHISSPDQIKVLMTDFIARLKENFAFQGGQLVLPTENLGDFWDLPETHVPLEVREAYLPEAKEAVHTIDEEKFILKLAVIHNATGALYERACTVLE